MEKKERFVVYMYLRCVAEDTPILQFCCRIWCNKSNWCIALVRRWILCGIYFMLLFWCFHFAAISYSFSSSYFSIHPSWKFFGFLVLKCKMLLYAIWYRKRSKIQSAIMEWEILFSILEILRMKWMQFKANSNERESVFTFYFI